jgi:hypothetical protein
VCSCEHGGEKSGSINCLKFIHDKDCWLLKDFPVWNYLIGDSRSEASLYLWLVRSPLRARHFRVTTNVPAILAVFKLIQQLL